MSELSSWHCSFLLAVGAAASVMTLSAVQYVWAIDWAQFLKAASFEVVARLVEFVQSSCAEAPLRISDWMDSAHCFSLTPRHCASAVAGFNQNAARVMREAAGIVAKGFIDSVLRVILLVFSKCRAKLWFLHPLNGGICDRYCLQKTLAMLKLVTTSFQCSVPCACRYRWAVLQQCGSPALLCCLLLLKTYCKAHCKEQVHRIKKALVASLNRCWREQCVFSSSRSVGLPIECSWSPAWWASKIRSKLQP